MKRFYCQCGNPLFFESSHCVACAAPVGFDPAGMHMLRLTGDELLRAEDGREFRRCGNGVEFDVCNWLRPADNRHPLCFACQFNRTVPNQSLPENQRRWKRLEEAKKRLFFSLMELRLPLISGWDNAEQGLLLDFVEDSRTQLGYPETFASTGYLSGVITINSLEADDVARVSAKKELNEPYRTLLGHLRHESGHYYWSHLKQDEAIREEFARLFGDETRDYRQALEFYYGKGPSRYWSDYYISAYASSHPAEDWAETWGHYLHIYDALETAAAYGILNTDPARLDMTARIASWREISVALNELNRSIGRQDAYPFVINEHVASKLSFVDRAIGYLKTSRPVTG